MSAVPPPLTECAITDIAAVLSERAPDTAPSDAAERKAAVAVVLRETDNGMEMLFIQRAHHPLDPWSGQMAFPGGRQDPIDDTIEAAARRETFEEVGLLLTPAMLIGRLHDVTGGRLSDHRLSVSPFVYHGPEEAVLVLNHEVADAVWVPVAYITDPGNVGEYRFPPDPLQRAFPCFHYRSYTIWGLTYRIIADFADPFGVALPRELPVTDVE